MGYFGVVLGILLIIGGYCKFDFLLEIFSYHNPFMEIFGKKRFCKGCIILGIFLCVLALIEIVREH